VDQANAGPNGGEPLEIREATVADAAACTAIYRPYVLDTVITFETEPPSAEAMAVRIGAALQAYAWLVLTDAGRVVGYAYGGQWKVRAAYRWTAEVSVYLEVGRRRSGAGRALYDRLLTRLAERGYLVAIAGMTLPNEPSQGLHRALGFEDVGSTAGSVGRTGPGTTSPGCSGPSVRRPSSRVSPGDRALSLHPRPEPAPAP